MATFLCAAKASVDGGHAQLIDQYGVPTLIHEGWLVQRWSARVREARGGSRTALTMF
ncbi:MAG: hypothetical protein WBD41_06865 [Rhodococcus sp. (in: high G+C Gram-positive bacteria)]|uniref:hypothetical protein n=1 Tax=Rhodococcus sp. EPR-157 TaxID=1813677 RepID=UPI002F9168C5